MMDDAPFSVAGKVAIVTGAGSGINLAFTALLLSKGCNVVLADLALLPEAQALIDQYPFLHPADEDPDPHTRDSDDASISARNSDKHNSSSVPLTAAPRALFIPTDVRSWPALERLFRASIDSFGDLDVLVPGAGVYEPQWSSFWYPPGSEASRDQSDANGYAMMDINVVHPIRATQLAMQYWLHPDPNDSDRKPASVSNPKRVIHLSSVAGQLPVFRAPLYAASKFAITGFVRSLAPIEQKYGIRVSAVAPGVVRTPLWTDHPEKLGNVDEQDGWVTPQEVADAMLALAEANEYPSGTILEIGKDSRRVVEAMNDAGPDMNPQAGLATRNSSFGDNLAWACMADEAIWKAPV